MRLGGPLLAAALCAVASGAFAADPLRIGVGAPLSGPTALFGEQIKLGVEQAVADLNASGGVLGRKARVVAHDDAGDPQQAGKVAGDFVTAGVKIVVGHFSTATTVPASTIYGEAKVLDITPSAEAPLVTERGLSTVFRTCGREDRQAEVAARFLLGRHLGKIAIVHDRTGPGKALADALRDALSKDGTADVAMASVAEGARDMGALVTRLRNSGRQAVFWAGGAGGAALLARSLKDANAPILLLGGMATASDDFGNLAGAAADGAFTIFPEDPRERPAAADLLRRLKARGTDPGAYVFYAYAAVQVVRAAAAAAGSLDPEKLAAAMHGGATYQTVLGPMSFDAKGDPKASDLAVYVWHKGPSGRMEFLDKAPQT